MKYINPVVSGFYPDPSVCRVKEDYFLVTSSFEFFPSIPIFHSKNLVEWNQIGHCITNDDYLHLPNTYSNCLGIYAPTIRYNNGTYYVICTNVVVENPEEKRTGNFIVSTNNPFGEWSKPIWLECEGIDPSLFFDDDGKVYYTGTHGGVYVCEIDIENGKTLSEIKYLWSGTGGCAPEAPHIYKKEGWYYLMLAEGGTEYGHCETIARSKDIFGPYIPYENNPIISNRGLGAPIMASGHADLVQDQNNNWWAVCLGIRPISYPFRHNLGRETFLAPVEWNEGWPVVNGNGVIEVENESPLLDKLAPLGSNDSKKHPKMPMSNKKYEFYDDFKNTELDLKWNYQYTANNEIVKLSNNGLLLKADKPALAEKECISFLGLRQMHHNASFKASLSFDASLNEEAGISVYMNREHHYDIAIMNIDNERFLILKRQIGTLWKIEEKVKITQSNVELEILSDKEWYYFNYSFDGKNFDELGKGEVAYLTTEVGGKFTGNYYALYASSNGGNSNNFAKFNNVKYENK